MPLSGASALKGKLLSIDIIRHLGSEMFCRTHRRISMGFLWLHPPTTTTSDVKRMSGMRYHPVMSQSHYNSLKSTPDGFKHGAYCTSEVPDIAELRRGCVVTCEKLQTTIFKGPVWAGFFFHTGTTTPLAHEFVSDGSGTLRGANAVQYGWYGARSVCRRHTSNSRR